MKTNRLTGDGCEGKYPTKGHKRTGRGGEKAPGSVKSLFQPITQVK